MSNEQWAKAHYENDLKLDPQVAELDEQQGDALAIAWAEGYAQGIADERTSEANIGIAGFNCKIEPARENPYPADHQTGVQVPAGWKLVPSMTYPKVVAWLGTGPNGGADVVTTSEIKVREWRRLGLTIVPLVEQTAQGIDLGQFIALAKFGEEFAFSAEKQPHSRVVYSQASRLLALIDQRDATTGVKL